MWNHCLIQEGFSLVCVKLEAYKVQPSSETIIRYKYIHNT